VLAVTGVLKAMVAASGVPLTRIEVVPNGIEPSRFAALPARPATPDPVTLGFVGFVRDWHGLDTVIAAMAADPATRLELVVVGDGPAVPALDRQAAALGVADRVRFAGLVAHDAIPGLVAGFDIALQPRVVAYASPLKLFEYMAAGKAIIAPDQANIREVLRDGETALLFDPAAPDTMWSAIRRLAADPPLRGRLGAAASAEVGRGGYTWRANAERVVAWAKALAPRG
jgi:glycosyltransferase involved in cell wall biosynthesis